MQTINVVSTMYGSEKYLNEFVDRITKTIEQKTNDFKIILVNDGALDRSLAVSMELKRNNPNISILNLSKNYGHHKAIFAGLSYTNSEYVFLIDCDLEEPPEIFLEFWEKLHDENCDVVYGVQDKRKGGIFEKFSGFIFYKLFNYFSGVSIAESVTTVRLMRKSYVDSLRNFKESEVFFPGIFSLAGFKQIPLIITKLSTSESTYTLFKKIKMFINALTSFSSKPLYAIFYMGVFISFISLLMILRIFYLSVYHNVPVEGWSSIMVSMWFIGGAIIFCTGILGVYIHKIFIEIKHRPRVIVKELIE